MADTERHERIKELIRKLPEGFVATYGDLCPEAPRLPGRVLKMSAGDDSLPNIITGLRGSGPYVQVVASGPDSDTWAIQRLLFNAIANAQMMQVVASAFLLGIGLTLKGTPGIVMPSGVAGLTFKDEAETVNALVPELRAKGIEAIAVLIHEGGFPTGGMNDCPGISGASDAATVQSQARLTNPLGLPL